MTIAWQVYAVARLSHDVRQAAFAVGMIGLAQFLPVIALTLPAGEIADRYDRRLIAAICLAVDAATAAALAILAFVDGHAIWPIYVAAILFGSARTFLSPANTALGPMLVPRPLLPKAIAWTSLAWQGASIIGPALGGVLCAISPVTAFGVAFGFYLASAGCLMLIRAETSRRSNRARAGPWSRRAWPMSGPTRSCSGRSRSTCSPCCSAARPRCCRCSRATS